MSTVIDCDFVLFGGLLSGANRAIKPDFTITPLTVRKTSTRVAVYGGSALFSFNIGELLAHSPLFPTKRIAGSENRKLTTRFTCGRIIKMKISTIPTCMLFGSCGMIGIGFIPDSSSAAVEYKKGGFTLRDLQQWQYCSSGPATHAQCLDLKVTPGFGSLYRGISLDDPIGFFGVSFEDLTRKISLKRLTVKDFAIDVRITARVELTEVVYAGLTNTIVPFVAPLMLPEVICDFLSEDEALTYKDGLPYGVYNQTALDTLQISATPKHIN